MGNRAVLCFSRDDNDTGIYLHWNGGVESVLAFLEVCSQRKYRTPDYDPSYAMARLIGVCHEFFKGGLSLGVEKLAILTVDNWDNGAYVIGGNWIILERYGKGAGYQKTVEELTKENKEKYNSIVTQLMEDYDDQNN